MTGRRVQEALHNPIAPRLVRTVSAASSDEAGGGSEEERKPWDFGRFLQTVALFTPLPSPAKFARAVLGRPQPTIPLRQDEDIWNVDNPLALVWAPLDDVVMGGVSESGFRTEEFFGVFAGFVDEANKGGFTGIRTMPLGAPLDLSRCTGIQLRVRGDGKRYKCVLRDSPDFNGIAWTAEFDVDDSSKSRGFFSRGDGWQVVKLPFDEFIPTRFANVLDEGTIDRSRIWAVQLVLSKYAYDGKLNPNFSPGDMELLVERITTY
eukprot:CAMPEP_0114507508 /NCGR_PEP_ID=MMETSP0109-20121206/12050_1 /TAXON_ID=29199 /ORGANISM="Chlorarachnion reptans, Strain CCCM449" /LENGTH=262 /DNA_ID=CAMNT_0001686271 /DNA_START=128 /DNA_END=916 /DNA_ORIENTATION=+